MTNDEKDENIMIRKRGENDRNKCDNEQKSKIDKLKVLIKE